MHTPIPSRYPIAVRLEILVTSYIVHLITTFIALPALIWHISSTNMHDDYGMPDDWIEEFNETQFTGGRGGLWGILFAYIPLDFLHALFALDYFHGRRYERKNELYSVDETARSKGFPSPYSPTIDASSPEDTYGSPKPHLTYAIIPLAIRPARTCHPIFAAFLSPLVRIVLLMIHDILLGTLLLAHISAFFRLLGPNREACDSYTSSYPENRLDPMNTSMSVLERCRRINVDMYVSGGFAVALYCILLGVHCWHLGFRMWELSIFGVEKEHDTAVDEEEEGFEEETRTLDGAQEARDWIGGLDMRGEGESTGIELCELDAGGRRIRGGPQNGSDIQQVDPEAIESISWREFLLECLVP